MRYDENYQSSDVEDRRAEGPVAGGGGGIPIGGLFWLLSRFGWHGLILGALIVGGIMIASHVGGGGGTSSPGKVVQGGPEEAQLVHFVEYVFDDVQRQWAQQIPNYRKAKLVLFRQSVRSACGVATSAVGPFYCPGDSKVYIDLAFYDELRRRFGAPGDFAQAYVIAHEMGHHIQNLLNLDSKQRGGSVPIELQADCLAGAWAKDADQRNLLEMGNLDEALNAASQIGDDTLQRKAGQQVQPETWTHGSSAQRSSNFRKGYDSGPHACGI